MTRKKLAIPSAVMLVIAVLVLACAPRPLAAQELPNLDKKTAEEVLPKKPYSPNVDRELSDAGLSGVIRTCTRRSRSTR